MSNLNVYIPYTDFTQLQQDSAKLASVIAILGTEFPDDTCQLIAIKSVLGIEEEKEEEPTDPVDPNPDDTQDPGNTDPTDPPAGGDPDPTDPPTGDPGSDPTP